MELPDEQVAALDELMKETRIRTRKDLFNNALTLFEWAVKQKRAGRGIGSIDASKENVRELLMPALESVPADLAESDAPAAIGSEKAR